jgi:hypothetical protein
VEADGLKLVPARPEILAVVAFNVPVQRLNIAIAIQFGGFVAALRARLDLGIGHA